MSALALSLTLVLLGAPAAKPEVLSPPSPPASPTALPPVAPAPPPAPIAAAPVRVLPGYARIAIMPLSSLGSTDDAVAPVERILQNELRKLVGERLITAFEIGRYDLRLPAQLARCDGVLDCLTDVFGAFGWRAFIVGNVTGLGGDRALNLKLIDAGTGKELRRVAEKASGDESTLIREIRKAAVMLLAPDMLVGVIELKVDQLNVRVLLDGELVGTTPLAKPRLSVPAGRHAIEASGDGLVTFSQMIELGYGETMPLTVVLPPNSIFVGGDTPFRHRWWPWAIAALGAASFGASAWYYHDHVATAQKIESLYNAGTLDYRQTNLHSRWQSDLTYSRGFAGIGAVLLLTTGSLFVVDFL
jgi:hypothetical protein